MWQIRLRFLGSFPAEPQILGTNRWIKTVSLQNSPLSPFFFPFRVSNIFIWFESNMKHSWNFYNLLVIPNLFKQFNSPWMTERYFWQLCHDLGNAQLCGKYCGIAGKAHACVVSIAYGWYFMSKLPPKGHVEKQRWMHRWEIWPHLWDYPLLSLTNKWINLEESKNALSWKVILQKFN